MFGSYGSYSSMLSASQPIDITYNSRNSKMSTSREQPSCAFPSWPRRDSLTSSTEDRPTSFLSDDDLFLSDPFDSDDAHSISSSDSAPTPPAMESPAHVLAGGFLQPQPMIGSAELAEMEARRAALQKEYVRQVMIEKERRRVAAKSKKRSSSSSSSGKKGSPRSKLSSMTSITE